MKTLILLLADAAYGNDHGFREQLEGEELQYVVGVQSSTSVWPPGTAPLPPNLGRPAAVRHGCCAVTGIINRCR